MDIKSKVITLKLNGYQIAIIAELVDSAEKQAYTKDRVLELRMIKESLMNQASRSLKKDAKED
jgi:hypothetical protein